MSDPTRDRSESEKALNVSLTPPETDLAQPGEQSRSTPRERVDPRDRQPGEQVAGREGSDRRYDHRREDDRAPLPREVTDPNYTAASAARYAQSDTADETRMQTGEVANLGRTGAASSAKVARDIMTPDVEVANPDTELYYVARMMAERDIGAVPVVESTDTMKPVGLITDRDITLRVIAKRQDPSALRARQVMSPDPVFVKPDDSIESIEHRMKSRQLRRLLVTDSGGRLIGIIAQADLARAVPPKETGRTVRQISEPEG